jgi:hypothetical protein
MRFGLAHCDAESRHALLQLEAYAPQFGWGFAQEELRRILRAGRGLRLGYLASPRLHSAFAKKDFGTSGYSRLPTFMLEWRAEGFEPPDPLLRRCDSPLDDAWSACSSATYVHGVGRCHGSRGCMVAVSSSFGKSPLSR